MEDRKTAEKPTTLAEIARQLGVTKGAVSLALRDSETVSADLKRRVNGLVKESGFKVRSYTRRQEKKASGNFSTGKIAILYRKDTLDPVTNTIMKSLANRLTQLDVSFGMFLRDDVVANPALLEDFSGFLYDYAWKPQDMPLLEGRPQVSIMNEEIEAGDFDSVKPDDREAGRLAANYLIQRGCRKIICVWELFAVHRAERNIRLEGFRWWMRDRNYDVTEIGYNKREGLMLLTDHLRNELRQSEEPVGIFTFCDQVADHVCTVLDFLGIRREAGKVELVSCDNTYLAQQLAPPIVTVDLHIEEIAERAVDMLLWRIANPAATYCNMQLKPSLIIPDLFTT